MDRTFRAHWLRLIAAASAVLAGAFVMPRLMPAPDLDENRPLAEAPAWPKSVEDLEAFRKGADAYVADRFPPRAQLIGLLNGLRMSVGVSGSSRVLVGEGGWLFNDDGSHLGASRGQPPVTDEQARAWLAAVAGRSEALRAAGRGYVVLIPPMKEAVYPEVAPYWFKLDLNRPAVTLSKLADAADAGEVVYPYAGLERQARWGTQVYDLYDTHWTGLGAYEGYLALMQSLQRQGLEEPARPLAAFTEQRDLPEGALPRNLALMLGVASFVDVRYPQFDDPAIALRMRTTYLTTKQDWTGLRVIDTGQTGKPVLLMTVDSFSNALLPFLYGHFSRIVTSHGQDGMWRRDLIDRFQPDFVVLEVLEGGARSVVLDGGPPASPQALARIESIVADRSHYRERPRAKMYYGLRRRVDGGPEADILEGSAAPDDLQGYAGDDTISSLGGDDVLRGGRGRDLLDGGLGTDWISGGRDDDRLRGGPGADIFDSFAGAGTDEILDFSAAEGDRVEISQRSPYSVRQEGAHTVVEMAGARLILRGVELARLPADWIRAL